MHCAMYRMQLVMRSAGDGNPKETRTGHVVGENSEVLTLLMLHYVL